MWYLWQHISLKLSFEYAQIIQLYVIYVTTHFFKWFYFHVIFTTKMVIWICTNHSFNCDICDNSFLLMVIWICTNSFIYMSYLQLKWSFEYAQSIHLHVIFAKKDFTKIVIWICTNHLFACDICYNTFP